MNLGEKKWKIGKGFENNLFSHILFWKNFGFTQNPQVLGEKSILKEGRNDGNK